MVKLENYGALSVVILSFETPQMWYSGNLRLSEILSIVIGLHVVLIVTILPIDNVVSLPFCTSTIDDGLWNWLLQPTMLWFCPMGSTSS